MEKILLPIDGSQDCMKSYEMAKDMAKKYNADIVLLNVQSVVYNWAYQARGIKEDRDARMELGKKVLDKGEEYFKDENINVVTKVSIGDPASEIIDMAKGEDIDLIVMCTHGMSAAKRFTIGSVTNKVVHHAATPVLVVR